jgi:hypothetical protein
MGPESAVANSNAKTAVLRDGIGLVVVDVAMRRRRSDDGRQTSFAPTMLGSPRPKLKRLRDKRSIRARSLRR